MGQTSDPETLVMHQKMTPGNNTEDFKQHYDHDGSLQLHIQLQETVYITLLLHCVQDMKTRLMMIPLYTIT
jgi:hypothetical protein